MRKKGKCLRSGPITVNPFFNFMRDFRRTHCGLTVIEAAKEGGKAWRKMSRKRKEHYKKMGENLKIRPRPGTMKARKERKGRKGRKGRPSLRVTPQRVKAKPCGNKCRISKKKRAPPKLKAAKRKVVKRSVGRKANSSPRGNKARKPLRTPKMLVRVRDLKAKQKQGKKRSSSTLKSEASMESSTTDADKESGTDAAGAGGATMEERPSSSGSLSVGKKPSNGPSNDEDEKSTQSSGTELK